MLLDLSPSDDHTNSRDAVVDSVQPVVDHGLVDFWDGEPPCLAEGVQLLATPGHSPGSAVVLVQSDSRTVILSGDVVHHPMQILHPAQPTSFDADAQAAVASRLHILTLASDTDAVLLPAHFPGSRVPRIASTPTGFTISAWDVMPLGVVGPLR
jgi:glyoxylase-like metal-dependent hydrolase (beta-lactamase superfamily II)